MLGIEQTWHRACSNFVKLQADRGDSDERHGRVNAWNTCNMIDGIVVGVSDMAIRRHKAKLAKGRVHGPLVGREQ